MTNTIFYEIINTKYLKIFECLTQLHYMISNEDFDKPGAQIDLMTKELHELLTDKAECIAERRASDFREEEN